MSEVRVTRYAVRALREVAVPRMTLAVLSDFHAAAPFMTARRIRRIVRQTNALAADLVLLLGDYAGHVIGGRDIHPDAVAAELSRLTAPLGVFAVFGNHDWRDDPAPRQGDARPTIWHRAFAAHGIATLSNSARTIRADGGALQLAGLESQQAFKHLRAPGRLGAHDVSATLDGLDPGILTILMAHEPDIFPALRHPVDLVLSGHTHGGQIAPFGRALIVPSLHGRRYAYGRFRSGERQMIVTGGLGTTMLPLRLGRPPEIVLVDLA